MIIAGLNHSVPFDGSVFHVQTQHHESPAGNYIEAEVFCNGQLLLARRLHRAGLANTAEECRALTADLRKVHKAVIQRLLSGGLALGEQQQDVKAGPKVLRMGRVGPQHSAAVDRDLRRLLARFIRAVGPSEPAGTEDLVQRLRSIATSLAVILGHPLTAFLRRSDLAELVICRSEAIEILSPSPGSGLGTSLNFDDVGLALWHHFDDLARSLEKINSRRALIELDQLQLAKCLERLSSVVDEDQPIDRDSLADLKLCWGRDEELDALLATPIELTVGKAQEKVRRLQKDLDQKLAALPPGSTGGDSSVEPEVAELEAGTQSEGSAV